MVLQFLNTLVTLNPLHPLPSTNSAHAYSYNLTTGRSNSRQSSSSKLHISIHDSRSASHRLADKIWIQRAAAGKLVEPDEKSLQELVQPFSQVMLCFIRVVTLLDHASFRVLGYAE